MSGGRRYCISCGSEVTGTKSCSNPECGTPNFYASFDPESGVREHQVARPHRSSDDVSVANGAAGIDERATLSISGSPIAFLRGESNHSIYPGTTEIGARPPARIIIDHPAVSARHATIHCVRLPSGTWDVRVVDRDSKNGTFVNEARAGEQPLRDGDLVRFARCAFRIRFLQTEAADDRLTIPLDP